MSNHTHQTAPTQFVEANGVRFAFRRFGEPAGIPLVFTVHFGGNMDSWDPAVTDGLARGREVILFDNAGVGASTGKVPSTFAEMAKDAAAFIDALGLKRVDVLGFSIGSFVAQMLALHRPDLVRKLILVGSSPRNGDGMPFTPESQPIFADNYDADPDAFWLRGFFGPSPANQQAGRAFLARRDTRTVGRDMPSSERVASAQVAAIQEWSQPIGERFAYLADIKQPVLIVNGTRDVIYYTANSLLLEHYLPNAEAVLYPDSAHGSLFQYPSRFVEDAAQFLSN